MNQLLFNEKKEISDFLYIETTEGMHIYADKILVYENSGISIYKSGNLISFIPGTNIRITNYDNFRYDIWAQGILFSFKLNVVFKEIYTFLDVRENHQIGDLVIRYDNQVTSQILFQFISADDHDISQIIKYSYVIEKVTDLGNNIQILTLKKDAEFVQVLSSHIISLGNLIKISTKISSLNQITPC